jgi:hypothetical protein
VSAQGGWWADTGAYMRLAHVLACNMLFHIMLHVFFPVNAGVRFPGRPCTPLPPLRTRRVAQVESEMRLTLAAMQRAEKAHQDEMAKAGSGA